MKEGGGSAMRIRPRAGFTLPELLLTAAILSYSISVILVTYINCIALNETSRNLTTAVSHAQYVLETVRNTSFSSIATTITANTWDYNTAGVTALGLTALKSEAIDTSSSGTNPLDVTVTVTWNDLNGRSRSQALKTSISG